MKIQQHEQHVISHGGMAGKANTYKIAATAHAFKMLSSGLYSDKVAAVLREIGCNAHDAHILGGIPDVPFDVKLPNALDTQFFIRDYGPGLAHEDVEGLYSTYFSSTKQNSNDFTGAFGLGSKSPFSYTDSFTVVSCHNGKKRTYSAHLDNTGAPNIVLVSETNTTPDWKHGLMIGFAVKNTDFAEFERKAQQTFCVFNPLPNILGSGPITPVNLVKSTPTWSIVNDHRIRGPVSVKMGNVVYQVNIGALTTFPTVMRYAFVSGNSAKILIHADMGTLQVAASREELQYDPATVANLTAMVRDSVKGMVLELEKEWLAKRGGTWKDRCNFNALEDMCSNTVNLSTDLLKTCGVKDPEMMYSEISRDRVKVDVPMTSGMTAALMEKNASRPGSVQVRDMSNTVWVNRDPELKMVLGEATGAYGRTRKAVLDGSINRAILVYPSGKSPCSRKDLERFADTFDHKYGDLERVDLSTLPKPPAPKKVKKGTLRPLDGIMGSRNGTDVDLGQTPDRVYMVRHTKSSWGNINHRYKFGDIWYNNWDYSRLIENVKLMNKKRVLVALPNPIFVSPNTAVRAKFDKRPDWVTFDAALREELEKPALQKEIAKIAAGYKPKILLDQHRGPYELGFLRNYRYLRQRYPELSDMLDPVFEKHGSPVLEKLEWMEKYGEEDINKMPTIPVEVEAFNRLVTALSLNVTVPALDKKMDKFVDKTHPVLDAMTCDFLSRLAELSPTALAELVDAVLTKEKA